MRSSLNTICAIILGAPTDPCRTARKNCHSVFVFGDTLQAFRRPPEHQKTQDKARDRDSTTQSAKRREEHKTLWSAVTLKRRPDIVCLVSKCKARRPETRKWRRNSGENCRAESLESVTCENGAAKKLKVLCSSPRKFILDTPPLNGRCAPTHPHPVSYSWTLEIKIVGEKII